MPNRVIKMSKIPLCKVVAMIPCQDFAYAGNDDDDDDGDEDDDDCMGNMKTCRFIASFQFIYDSGLRLSLSLFISLSVFLYFSPSRSWRRSWSSWSLELKIMSTIITHPVQFDGQHKPKYHLDLQISEFLYFVSSINQFNQIYYGLLNISFISSIVCSRIACCGSLRCLLKIYSSICFQAVYFGI